MYFFLALCSAISPSCLGRLPWNLDTWLGVCALIQCMFQNLGESPQNFFRQVSFCIFTKSSSSLDRLPWNFAKWWEISGALKIRSKNLCAPGKKCGEKQKFKNWHTFCRIRENKIEESVNNLTKLSIWCDARGMRICIQICFGPAPLKFAGALIEAISGNFWLWSQISSEWIKISTSKNGVINSIPAAFDEKHLVNFGQLTTKFTCFISTNPQSTVHAISDNSGLRSWISLERIKQSTSRNGIVNCGLSHVQQKRFGELWSTNRKSYRRSFWPTQHQHCAYSVG